jgi:hypothetical protein
MLLEEEMASVLKLTPRILLAIAVLILGVGFGLGKYLGGRSLTEGMTGVPTCNSCNQPVATCSCRQKVQTCNSCNQPASACGCKGISRLVCPPCREPDLSKYVLKSSIPRCPSLPDLTHYMLKTECPPVPDLSKYVLKSSIPKQQPVIIDNSACKKDAGECPPCPRPRCPTVTCPPAQSCPAPAPCPRPVCAPQKVKCKAENPSDDTVRPFLAPLNMSHFGMGM